MGLLIPSCFGAVSLLDFSLEISLGQKCVAWMNTKQRKKERKNQDGMLIGGSLGKCGESERWHTCQASKIYT